MHAGRVFTDRSSSWATLSRSCRHHRGFLQVRGPPKIPQKLLKIPPMSGQCHTTPRIVTGNISTADRMADGRFWFYSAYWGAAPGTVVPTERAGASKATPHPKKQSWLVRGSGGGRRGAGGRSADESPASFCDDSWNRVSTQRSRQPPKKHGPW